MNWEYDLERLLEDELDIYLHIGELDKISKLIKSLLKEQRKLCTNAAAVSYEKSIGELLPTEVLHKILNAPEPVK